jgi:RsiW-degrading membrane proteinase PrsW (M82 family)
MNHIVKRLLSIVAVVTVVAFVTAWAFRNSKSGAGEIVGGIAWFTLLGGLAALIVLGLTAAVMTIRSHGSRRATS